MKKTISIITTLRHNIGDDFVREGIASILGDILGEYRIEAIHKHSPVTCYYGFEGIRNLRASKILEPALRRARFNNRIADADILIQSGAPVYWCHPKGPHCADNEWYNPLIQKTLLRDKSSRKFISLAGGSCQTYHSDGTEVADCPKCNKYIANFHDACGLTLLRDNIAKKMLNTVGRDADVLPCTSIFARDRFDVHPENRGYIAVNFMEQGGHYSFGQNISASKWRNNFRLLVNSLRHFGRVIAACHTKNEESIAKDLFPDVDTYIVPNDHRAFIDFYSGSRFAVVNRVHAGFMAASFGKPVAVIGTDSRAQMISNLGLESYYVEDIDQFVLERIIASLLEKEKTYIEEIEKIRSTTRSLYIAKIAKVLNQ